MLRLYDFGNSVCCQKLRIPLRAKALDWESVKVDLFKPSKYKALGVLAAATIRK